MALALLEGELVLLRKAALAVAGGVAIVLATAIVIGFTHRDVPLTLRRRWKINDPLFAERACN
jgi:hypothetical protein